MNEDKRKLLVDLYLASKSNGSNYHEHMANIIFVGFICPVATQDVEVANLRVRALDGETRAMKELALAYIECDELKRYMLAA